MRHGHVLAGVTLTAALLFGLGASGATTTSIQTMRCVQNGQPWAVLQINTTKNVVAMSLMNPSSVGPGNYSGHGAYPAKISNGTVSWTLPFSATQLRYVLNLQTGALAQSDVINATGAAVGNSPTITCS